MSDPFFSVLITAYNREGEIERCVRSAMQPEMTDCEIVVVDDASTDGTVAVLEAIDDPRLRIVRQERNGGISPARAATVRNARGRWLVLLDSDWELLPGSLARLREVIDGLDSDVRIIRSQLRWDGGEISPVVIPDGVTDYEGRLRWLEQSTVEQSATDAGHCIARAVYDTGTHFHEGRGLFESYWETELARTEKSMWLAEPLGLEHADAANSSTRETDVRRVIPRMTAEAHDFAWQLERMVDEHGAALGRFAPHYRRQVLERAALESLLASDRRTGLRRTIDAARAGVGGPQLWVTLALGLVDARLLAWAKVRGRQWRGRRRASGPAT